MQTGTSATTAGRMVSASLVILHRSMLTVIVSFPSFEAECFALSSKLDRPKHLLFQIFPALVNKGGNFLIPHIDDIQLRQDFVRGVERLRFLVFVLARIFAPKLGIEYAKPFQVFDDL